MTLSTPGLTGLALLGLAALLPAQHHWTLVHSTPPPVRTPMAVSMPQLGRVLRFSREPNDDYSHYTYEWNGARWLPVPAATLPPGRFVSAMAFDLHRERAVVFGGWGDRELLGDTWEWDGSDWAAAQPQTAPAPREGHAMVYDAARRRIVLFGGWNRTSRMLGDTWVYDGNDWTAMTPAASPSPREYHALAFDAARQRVVLFGGTDGTAFFQDTWEWDGATWTERQPQHAPTRRAFAGMAYDAARARTVLVGGRRGAQFLAMDAWEWDGRDWAHRPSATRPPPRLLPAIAFDTARGQIVVQGGMGENRPELHDTWTWDGTSWVERGVAAPLLGSAQAVTDTRRGRVVLFGGRDPFNTLARDTWLWDGADWTLLPVTLQPPSLEGHRMAYDSLRDEIVLYVRGVPPHTWLFDGTVWRDAAPPTSPPDLWQPGMTFDAARGEVVLFGGIDRTIGPAAVSDVTWLFDGTTWRRANPSTRPSARSGVAMAFDVARNEVVLTGGHDGTSFLDETWVWDGTSWAQRFPQHSPGEHFDHEMVYDHARQRIVIVDLHSAAPFAPPLMEWDGTDWSAIQTSGPLPLRLGGASAYDPVHGRVILVGGSIGSVQPDTWMLTPTPASAATFGTACAGTHGTLELRDSGLPRLGAPFQLEVVRAAPNSLCAVALSLAAINLPVGPCTFYHDPATSLFGLPLPTDAHGVAFLPIPDLPLDTALRGIPLFGQAAALDPGVPLGFVLSAGLRLEIGD